MSTQNPYVEARKRNIQTLKELIRDESPIKHNRVVAIMGVEGLREKTVLSYLKILQNADFIAWNNDENTWKIKK